MRQTCQTGFEPRFTPGTAALREQVAAAVQNRATPLSHLLRLMAALDAQGGDETLRQLLRTRIGAPLSA